MVTSLGKETPFITTSFGHRKLPSRSTTEDLRQIGTHSKVMSTTPQSQGGVFRKKMTPMCRRCPIHGIFGFHLGPRRRWCGLELNAYSKK